jgi:hypothetical protein
VAVGEGCILAGVKRAIAAFGVLLAVACTSEATAPADGSVTDVDGGRPPLVDGRVSEGTDATVADARPPTDARSTGVVYTTTFPLTENPISESGVWTTGNDSFQSAVRTSGGLAYGTQTGNEWQQMPALYNDSQCYLSGFPSNHRGEMTIHMGGVPRGDLEIEVLLGWSVGGSRTAHFGTTHSDGIECSITLGEFGVLCLVARYLTVAEADFSHGPIATLGVRDGDIFAAQLVLDHSAMTGTVTLSLTRAGTETILGSATHAEFYRVGQPGFAFYRQNNGAPDDPTLFCAAAYTARGLP